MWNQDQEKGFCCLWRLTQVLAFFRAPCYLFISRMSLADPSIPDKRGWEKINIFLLRISHTRVVDDVVLIAPLRKG